MIMPDSKTKIINRLSSDITDSVGNIQTDELDTINTSFNKTLIDALNMFNSSTFDDDGFIKRMRDIDLGDVRDKDTIKNVLNNVRSDYINVDSMNQSELLLRRDIYNICTQMPEMHDVINIVRDSIIECNVANGEVSRSLLFENHEDDDSYETQVKEIEERNELLLAIKNFIVPKGLMHGEMYIQVTPYAKLFAELEAINNDQYGNKTFNTVKGFKESVPADVMNFFTESVSLYNEDNLKILMESASPMTKIDNSDINSIYNDSSKNNKSVMRNDIKNILENINVYNGSSTIMAEYGVDGFIEMIMNEYKRSGMKKSGYRNFNEAQMNFNKVTSGIFKNVDQDAIDFASYSDIKGAYIKYLDGLRLIPIRMDRRVIGYYYVSTTMDLQTNAANPNGIIDLSYQNYTRDRNMVDQLSQLIIKSFNKSMLEKNIKLKNEIVQIIMAHKFSEGKLSFIYIPENEIVRIILNEDENGKGHSILEPTLFPARMYLMLTLYNMLYTLNNNTTRVHYLKSSGLNKDYKSQIQRTMRKFQQRRITIDDIYSYSGVLNKIGGMGEMVLPAGRNDYKAIETDTIPAAENPINLEFLEQQRRQAITGTGVPQLLVINGIDEVDFAKTLEMANTRFISTISSYKIDFNRGVTLLYRKLLKYCTDIEDSVINSFKFKFNTVRQQELNITADMIQNFNQLVDTVKDIYFTKDEMENQNGDASRKQIRLRRKLAEIYLPDLNFDLLDDVVSQVELDATDDELQDKVKDINITDEDIDSISKKPNE
jgi:hypothetical protein